MKKNLNTEAIANELRDLSPFFQLQAVPPASTPLPVQSPQPPTVQQPVSEQSFSPPARDIPNQETEPIRTGGTPRTSRTGIQPAKRQMKRHPFEIYFDQYESLVRLA